MKVAVGAKPILKPDAEALTKAPAAPPHLSKEAKAEWKRVMPQLIARRIITAGDLYGIEAYCMAAGAVRQIDKQLASTTTPDLKLAGLQIRYMLAATRLAAEYGLTPTSRTRVGANISGDDDDANPLTIGRARQ